MVWPASVGESDVMSQPVTASRATCAARRAATSNSSCDAESPVDTVAKWCFFPSSDAKYTNIFSPSSYAPTGSEHPLPSSARNARYLSGGRITLQGNFDPSRLLSPIPTIKKMVHQMINEFGKDRYIVNLGHGVYPDTPLDGVKCFVDTVKSYHY